MSTQVVHLREIDLTRHVKTPAGVKYFHKPIGSPIGNSTGHRVAKAVERGAKAAESAATPSSRSRSSKVAAAKAVTTNRGVNMRPTSRAMNTRKPGDKFKVKVDEHGKVKVERHPEGISTAPLSKSEARRVEEILNNAKTPDDIHAALLKATNAQKYHIVRKVVAQSKAAHDYLEKNGDQLEHGTNARVEKVLSGLYRIIPWMKDTIERARMSGKADAIRDFKWLDSIIAGSMDAILKGATGVALGTLLAHVGIHLVGG